MTAIGARQRNRDVAELMRWVGRQLREQRLDAGLTQAQLAGCAQMDQGHLSRIEAGRTMPGIATLVALARCLGSELGIRLFPTSRPRIRDRFQAPMVDALIAATGPSWNTRPELPVPAARGVIDLVLTRSLDHLTVACECHSELRRLEEAIRRAHDKAESLRAQIGNTGTVSQLLLLRSTRATRDVARTYEATLAAAYPARSVDALEALRGNAAWPGHAIVWATVLNGRAEILGSPPRGVRVGR